MRRVTVDDIIRYVESGKAQKALPQADSSVLMISGDDLLVIGKRFSFGTTDVEIDFHIVEGEGGVLRESAYGTQSYAPPPWNTTHYTYRLIPESDPFVVEARLTVDRRHDVFFTLGGVFYVYYRGAWHVVRAGDLDP